jgi:mannosyltransferase OCH1-like enzyme
MIPKLFHQIWIQGYNNLPLKYKLYSDKWKLKCEKENYKYMLWDEENIKDLILKYDSTFIKVYEYLELYQQKSDLARYLILYVYGGIYSDIDTEPGNIIMDTVTNNKELIVSQNGFNIVSIAFLGSKINHQIFKDAIDHIKKSYLHEWYDILDVIYVERTTGGIITKLVKEKYNPFLIPKETVYICYNINDCEIDNNKMVALVHFEKTWNITKYISVFLVLYKWVITIAAILMMYLYHMKCKQLYDICEYKNILLVLIVLSSIYNIILYKKNKQCINGLVSCFIFLIIYINLQFKCGQCVIKK